MHFQFRIILFFLTCLSVLPAELSAQAVFQQTFAISDSFCTAGKMAVTSTGNVMITGSIDRNFITTDSTGEGLVWMFNPQGDILWSLKFSRGNSNYVEISDVAPTPDGGGVVLINYSLSSTIFTNIGIVKIDAQGGIVWSKKMVPPSGYQLRHIKKLKDGYLISGVTAFHHSPLFKIDENGNIVYRYIYNESVLYAGGAFENAAGHIFVPGKDTDPFDTETFLIFDLFPDLYPDNTHYFQQPDQGTGPSGTWKFTFPEGDSILAVGVNDDADKIAVIKCDSTGFPGRTASYAAPGKGFELVSAADLPNGDILIAGISLPEMQSVVFCINPNLEIKWSKVYGKTDGTLLTITDLAPGSDGSIWLCGNYEKAGKIRPYLAHTGKDGEIEGGCCARDAGITGFSFPIADVNRGFPYDENLPGLNNGVFISGLRTTQKTPFCDDATSFAIEDTSLCAGRCLMPKVENISPSSDYTWSFAGGMPDSFSIAAPGLVCYPEPGKFTIELRQNGCLVGTDSIAVEDPQDQFPNAFTPNGDGKNETFKPLIYCPVEEYSMEIFNRWGDKIFETTDPETGWDGNVNGQPAPVDTYVYRVQFFAVKGTERILVKNEMKEVTLLR